MRLRHLALQLDDDPNTPPSRLLGRAIQKAIREGRLGPGMALPGSRALAEMLGINRNTVIAALHDLEAEGWLVSEPNRGTFVAPTLPEPEPAAPAAPTERSSPNFDLPSRLSPLSPTDPGTLVFSDGLPDAGLFPAGELAKAYQRALQRHSQDLLQAADPLGNRLLREVLALWLRERRGLVVGPDQILVTRGIRMALTLVCAGLLRDGAVVAVEDPGNRQAWETMLHGAKVQLRALPVDGEGLVVEALEASVRREPVRALYLTPHRQFPTTVALSAPRRARLLEIAEARRIAVIEEDRDPEYDFGGTSQLCLGAQDRAGQVVHIGSLSRLMAPGLRLGFLVAPRSLVGRLARLQRNLEWQGDRVLEWAVADLIRDGVLARHLRRARRIYEARRDRLAALLNERLGARLRVQPPEGGLALWLQPGEGVDLGAWIRAARTRGLLLYPPSYFAFEGPGQGTRMGYAHLAEPQLEEAVKRLGLAWEDLGTRG